MMINDRVVATFNGETFTGTVVYEFIDTESDTHRVAVKADVPRYSKVTGRMFESTLVDVADTTPLV